MTGREDGTLELRQDSFCGLNCGACPVGLANLRDDRGALEEMARQWGRNPDDLVCGGCKGDVTAAFCSRCGMRLCAMGKGLDFCFQCGDYPCPEISAFRNDEAPHHSVIFRNLRSIEEKGLAAWLAGEDARWSCPRCSRRYSWYEESCPDCGASLKNSVREERELED